MSTEDVRYHLEQGIKHTAGIPYEAFATQWLGVNITEAKTKVGEAAEYVQGLLGHLLPLQDLTGDIQVKSELASDAFLGSVKGSEQPDALEVIKMSDALNRNAQRCAREVGQMKDTLERAAHMLRLVSGTLEQGDRIDTQQREVIENGLTYRASITDSAAEYRKRLE
jgi:hypothetical protein